MKNNSNGTDNGRRRELSSDGSSTRAVQPRGRAAPHARTSSTGRAAQVAQPHDRETLLRTGGTPLPLKVCHRPMHAHRRSLRRELQHARRNAHARRHTALRTSLPPARSGSAVTSRPRPRPLPAFAVTSAAAPPPRYKSDRGRRAPLCCGAGRGVAVCGLGIARFQLSASLFLFLSFSFYSLPPLSPSLPLRPRICRACTSAA